MATMLEEQLGRTILRILRGLFRANQAEVPNIHTSIRTSTSEHSLVGRRESQIENIIRVPFKRMQRVLEVPHIPHADRLVA